MAYRFFRNYYEAYTESTLIIKLRVRSKTQLKARLDRSETYFIADLKFTNEKRII